MWLLTPIGFFSIVRKADDIGKATLTLRARVKSDLEALKERYLPGLSEIVETPKADYRYRAKAPRGDLAKALAKIVDDLDYDNFKNEVARRQGNKREELYHEVWSLLYGLQR